MNDPFDLQRFVDAQNAGDTYGEALREVRAERKTSHWMWFVFPQIAGLGHSATAQHYAISGLAEARAYLAHPILGPRLLGCADALTTLSLNDPVAVFGSIDAQKLRSSMTLFARAAPENATFTKVVGRYFEGRYDAATDRLLTAPGK